MVDTGDGIDRSHWKFTDWKDKKTLEWATNADKCKKGVFNIICMECGAQTDYDAILQRANNFLRCPNCDNAKFIIWMGTPTIHDYCEKCDENCKLPSS